MYSLALHAVTQPKFVAEGFASLKPIMWCCVWSSSNRIGPGSANFSPKYWNLSNLILVRFFTFSAFQYLTNYLLLDDSSEEPSHKEADESCSTPRIIQPPKPVEKERIPYRRTNETLQQFRIRIARRRISNRKRYGCSEIYLIHFMSTVLHRFGEGSRDQREHVRRRWWFRARRLEIFVV